MDRFRFIFCLILLSLAGGAFHLALLIQAMQNYIGDVAKLGFWEVLSAFPSLKWLGVLTLLAIFLTLVNLVMVQLTFGRRK